MVPRAGQDRAGAAEHEADAERRLHLGFGVLAILAALYCFLGLGGFGIILGLAFLGFAAWQFVTMRTLGIIFRNFGGGVLTAPAGNEETDRVEDAKRAINRLLFDEAPAPTPAPTAPSSARKRPPTVRR